MTNFNLNDLTFGELRALEDGIKAIKATKRDEAKAATVEAKGARVAQFKGNLGEGDTVSFLYGRDNGVFTGTVIRASEKSVTVQSAVFSENGKKDTNYVRYDRIVSVVSEATAEVEETAEETVEADAEADSEDLAQAM